MKWLFFNALIVTQILDITIGRSQTQSAKDCEKRGMTAKCNYIKICVFGTLWQLVIIHHSSDIVYFYGLYIFKEWSVRSPLLTNKQK